VNVFRKKFQVPFVKKSSKPPWIGNIEFCPQVLEMGHPPLSFVKDSGVWPLVSAAALKGANFSGDGLAKPLQVLRCG
jgi:hypothetical protein